MVELLSSSSMISLDFLLKLIALLLGMDFSLFYSKENNSSSKWDKFYIIYYITQSNSALDSSWLISSSHCSNCYRNPVFILT